jgi:hypothetical protein
MRKAHAVTIRCCDGQLPTQCGGRSHVNVARGLVTWPHTAYRRRCERSDAHQYQRRVASVLTLRLGYTHSLQRGAPIGCCMLIRGAAVIPSVGGPPFSSSWGPRSTGSWRALLCEQRSREASCRTLPAWTRDQLTVHCVSRTCHCPATSKQHCPATMNNPGTCAAKVVCTHTATERSTRRDRQSAT